MVWPAMARSAMARLVLTQGDPAGIGPEILLQIADDAVWQTCRPLFVVEKAALAGLREVLPQAPWQHLVWVDPEQDPLPPYPSIPMCDPVGQARTVTPGHPTAEDGRGALQALDVACARVCQGRADALITAPVNKATIARWVQPDFRGHTEYLAAKFGVAAYGQDHLMTFLTPDFNVALLTTHLPLQAALAAITAEKIQEALRCLDRHAPRTHRGRPRIAVAGVNPHAGEEGLLGDEDEREVRPAVAAARAEGIDAWGPESPDSVFARARRGEFDWVLALYHDQGLIAVKTAAFGTATHWTLGLPILRTSVDHGTAYAIAGRGMADPEPLRAVVHQTLELLELTSVARTSG